MGNHFPSPPHPFPLRSLIPIFLHYLPSLARGEPFEFLDEIFIPKTRVLGLYVGEDFVILAYVVFTQCQRVLDGRTDISTMASTGLA